MDICETNIAFQDGDGRRISAILAEPRGGTDRVVILAHGFLSNKNSTTNHTLTRLLLPAGMSTFRIDWFGMGQTEGRFADITVGACCDQLERALAWLQKRSYARLGCIGSSFGGLITTLVAGTCPDLSAIGLKCPVPDFPEMLRLEFGETGMNRWKQTDTIPNITGGTEPISLNFSFYEDCLRYDTYKAAETIKAPAVIVHGDRDEYVPLHQIHRLDEAIRIEKRLHLLPGADHRFSKPEDFQNMTTLLADWMTDCL